MWSIVRALFEYHCAHLYAATAIARLRRYPDADVENTFVHHIPDVSNRSMVYCEHGSK